MSELKIGTLCEKCKNHLKFKNPTNKEGLNYYCESCKKYVEKAVISAYFSFICPSCKSEMYFFDNLKSDEIFNNFYAGCKNCNSAVQFQPTIIGKCINKKSLKFNDKRQIPLEAKK